MRYLLTMNMPSANGFLVHQLTVDIAVNSCEELKKMMNLRMRISEAGFVWWVRYQVPARAASFSERIRDF